MGGVSRPFFWPGLTEMDTISKFELPLLTPADTRRLGFSIAEQVKTHALVALHGPLGAGKTTFAQGAAEALGVEEVVNSPTFTTINEYTSGRLPLYHLDLYRLKESSTTGGAPQLPAPADLHLLIAELDELRSAPGLLLVEWADCLEDYIRQQDHIRVELNYSTNPDEQNYAPGSIPESHRIARISAEGQQSSQIVELVKIVYFS